MANFIIDNNDQMVNADHIVHMKQRHDGAWVCTLTGSHAYPAISDDIAISLRGTLVPATPGFVSLFYSADDDPTGEYTLRAPVIAWRIDPEGFHKPVSLDDRSLDHFDISWKTTAVLCPDGTVHDIHEESWDSEADWLKWCRHWAEPWRTERAKKKAADAA